MRDLLARVEEQEAAENAAEMRRRNLHQEPVLSLSTLGKVAESARARSYFLS